MSAINKTFNFNISNVVQSKEIAIIVAGKNYRYDFPRWDGDAETARSIAQIDKSLGESHFQQEDISIFTHAQLNRFHNAPKFSTMIRGKPSKEVLEFEISTLSKEIKKGDRLWIYLIGHGLPLSSEQSGLFLDGAKGERESILSPKDLKQCCDSIPVKIDINIVADCCFSGVYVPLTSSNTQVFCSSNSKELSYGNALGERFGTLFAEQYNLYTKGVCTSLLETHLKSLDPEDSPGYDSYSYTLSKMITRRLLNYTKTEEHLLNDLESPSQRLSKYDIVNLDGIVLECKYPGEETGRHSEILAKISKIVDSSLLIKKPPHWHYSNLLSANERFMKVATPEEIEALESVAKRMI
jgi:hypothetical protein